MNILRFSVPGAAAEAANVRQLETRGRKAGVTAVQFGYRFAARRPDGGNDYRCRIACSAHMAVFFIEELRITGSDAMDRGDTPLAATCVQAIRETFASLMAPRPPRAAGRSRNQSTRELAGRL
jgi:hypothetical protein